MILISYYVSVVDSLFWWAWVSGIQNGMSIVIYQTWDEVCLQLWIIICFELCLPLLFVSLFKPYSHHSFPFQRRRGHYNRDNVQRGSLHFLFVVVYMIFVVVEVYAFKISSLTFIRNLISYFLYIAEGWFQWEEYVKYKMDYPPLYKKISKPGQFHILLDCCIQLSSLTCIMILISYYVSVVDGLF